MSWTQSLAMAIPTARQEVCNRLMEAAYRGPNTFAAVRIIDKTTQALVGYAAHTYDDELVTFFTGGAAPAGVTLARLQQFGFTTVAAARTAAGHIHTKVIADRQSVKNIRDLLDEQGWEIERAETPA